MSACSRRKVVGRAAFAPAVHKFSRSAGKTRSHVGIAKGKNLAFLVYALRYDKLEVSVSVLSNCKIGDGACVRIELCQIAAARLSVEHFYNLHGRLFVGNIRIAGAAVSDDGNVVVKVNGVHFGELSCSGDGL